MVFVLYLNTDYGFEIPDLFVVGYALDYNEYFRDLNVSFFKKKNKSLFYRVLETVIYLIPGSYAMAGSLQWVQNSLQNLR